MTNQRHQTKQGAALRPLHSHDMGMLILGILCLFLLLATDQLVEIKGNATSWASGPLAFPMAALTICALSALPSAWRMARSRQFPWRDALEFLRPKASSALLFVVLLIFLPCLYMFGLVPTTFCLLGLTLFLFGHRKAALPVAGVTTLVVWYVFVYLLDIYFPTPSLLQMLGGQ